MVEFLKKQAGLWFVLGAFVLNAIFWFTATPMFEQPLESVIGQWQGANILLGFTLVFFLATRNRLVIWLFNGLEASYRYHRFLGVLSVLLIFIHAQFSYLIMWNFRAGLPLNSREMGILARNLFILLIVIALLAKYIKYEHWRVIHRFMIIPYWLAFYHAYTLSSFDLFAFSPLSVWMFTMAAVGTGSSLYMLLFYRRIAFPHRGNIEKVTRINHEVTEIVIKTSFPYTFLTGQFAFVRIMDAPFKGLPHPFSLSGCENGKLYLTIKNLGDNTDKIYHHLKPHTAVRLTHPMGHMTFTTHQDKQVWIAGGIGITPFLSHLRSDEPLSQTITLYYAVNQKKEAVHLDLLEQLAKEHENFEFHLIEANKTGFLTLDRLDLKEKPAVMMCGPRPMVVNLKKALHKDHPELEITSEAFSFTGTFVEDIIRNVRNIWRKLTRH